MKSVLFPILLFPIFLSAQVTFVAHRGASFLAPENTLASIQLAWQLKSKAAECDVLLTKDQQIVVFHDKNTLRLLGKNYQIKESNYEDIKDYPINLKSKNLSKYEGQTIPLLQDVLATLPDSATLVIEIKCGPEILVPMQQLLSKHWNKGKIAFIAFDFETILQAKEHFPKVPCFFLAHFKNALNKRFEEIINSPLDGIDLNHAIVNKKIVKRLKKHGKSIWCYTVNNAKLALRMANLGVTGITTDRPKWLKEQVLLELNKE